MNVKAWLVSTCALAALTAASAVDAQATGAPPGPPASNGPATTGPAATSPVTTSSDASTSAEQTSQDTNAGSATSVSEVVVTGQSRAQASQRAPVALSVFTDARRNLLGIEDGKDITNYTPSMSLNGQFLSLRGVGRFSDALGTDPGVAVYVDGIYTNSPDYLGQPDFLTDRIEVLRGPQSTYGRNAIGGALNIVSKRPTDSFYAEARAGGTEYNAGYGQFVVSGPINDTLKYRLSYDYTYQGNGFENNVAPYTSVSGNGDTRIFEGQLEWKPTSKLDIWVRYQNNSTSVRPNYGQIAGPYQSGSPGNYDGLVVNPQFGLAPNSNPAIHNAFDVNVNTPGHVNTTDDHTVTLHATYDLPNATIRYIGGYSQYTFGTVSDADYTARDAITTPLFVPTTYVVDTTLSKSFYSHELNISSDNSNALKYVAGAYYYWESNNAPYYVEDVNQPYFAKPITNDPPLFPPAAPNPTRAYYFQQTRLRSVSEAVYGQLDYDFSSKLRVTGAARYNWDQKSGSEDYRYVSDALTFGLSGFSLDGTPPGAAASIHRDFSDWTGKIGLEYKPDSKTLAYVSATKGYKSGGLDLGNFTPIPVVAPETLYAYELGLKETPTKSLLIDAGLYYYDYHNLQVPITVSSTVGGASAGIVTPTLTSAQRARTYGFELESIWSPTADLHLTLTYSYLNAQFTRFTNALTAGGGLVDTASGVNYANLNGNTLPQSPENKVAFIPQYVLHVGGGDLSLSSNIAWIDSQYYAVFNTPNYRAPSYYNVDLRAVFQPKQAHWTAILYARNVTNQVQIVNYAAGGAGIASENVFYTNAPRVVGGELQYRF